MTGSDPIRQYLAELAKCFSSNGQPPERILREVEDHLRQRVEDLRAEGWEPGDAEQEAFDPLWHALSELQSSFEQQPPLPCEEEIMFRRSMTVLAALTSVYAALHVVFSLMNEPTAFFTYVKTAYALIVVGYGLLILHWQWISRDIGDIERYAIFVGGLGLIETRHRQHGVDGTLGAGQW